jgi:hypothetical protein
MEKVKKEEEHFFETMFDPVMPEVLHVIGKQ